MQALGDCGRFNQVASTQVTGDEVVKVSHQVLPSCSHVLRFSLCFDANAKLKEPVAVPDPT